MPKNTIFLSSNNHLPMRDHHGPRYSLCTLLCLPHQDPPHSPCRDPQDIHRNPRNSIQKGSIYSQVLIKYHTRKWVEQNVTTSRINVYTIIFNVTWLYLITKGSKKICIILFLVLPNTLYLLYHGWLIKNLYIHPLYKHWLIHYSFSDTQVH